MEEYYYIGSQPKFKRGDVLSIKKGYTFLIKEMVERGLISYDDKYTFERYNGYACGHNYCDFKELSFGLPEGALEVNNG